MSIGSGWSTGSGSDLLAIPSRARAVTDAIRRGILSGALPAGTPLVETELARRFGTSKTPVRDALRSLAGTGLVVFSDYKGAVVRSVEADMARHVFDIRRLLEPVAVARTVQLKTFDAESAHQSLARAAVADDPTERGMANRDFHEGLYSGCGNPILLQTLSMLRDQTTLISLNSWATDPSWDEEADEHEAILQAAQSGDGDRAAELVRQHINTFEDRALKHLENNSGSDR